MMAGTSSLTRRNSACSGIEASIEKQIETLLAEDYTDRLNAARARVRDAAD